MLGFKSADSARVILGGIELVHMMRKQQAKYACNRQLSLAEQIRAARCITRSNVCFYLCNFSQDLRQSRLWFIMPACVWEQILFRTRSGQSGSAAATFRDSPIAATVPTSDCASGLEVMSIPPVSGDVGLVRSTLQYPALIRSRHARMQALKWPGDTSSSGGTTAAHCSAANGQRVRKTQPGRRVGRTWDVPC